jgi:hypothetical protein
MHRLPPLRVGLLVTVPAVLRGQKAAGIDELSRVRRGIRREKWMPRTKRRSVVLGHMLGVGFSLRRCIVSRKCRPSPQRNQSAGNSGCKQQAKEDT